MKPIDCGSDIAAIAVSFDEPTDHRIRKLVGLQEKRRRGGEEEVGEEEIGNGGEALESVGIVVGIGTWI